MQISKGTLVRRTLEVILGGIFFYAGLQKLLHPYEFAEVVLAYQMIPQSLVGMAAAVLPWIEIAAGLGLAVGIKSRSSLLILAGLLIVFLVVILITIARGLKIDCGCGLFFQRQVGMVAIVEDLLLLAWAASLYWWELRNAGYGFLRLTPKTEKLN